MVRTREPGGSPGAEALREAILTGFAAEFGPAAQALMFAAARVDHLDKTILPALESGAWVVSDRFADSTRAYQGAAGNLPAEFIAGLERLTVGATRPDLTLILDLAPEVGLERALKRRQGKGSADRFESEGLAFHQTLRRAFLDIAAAEPRRCAVIDASGSESEVAAAIWSAVESAARSGGRAQGRPGMKKAESDDLPEADALPGAPHPRHATSLIGHKAAEQELLSAYREGRLAHAWLIGGREGIGKATLAWRFARFVLANPDPSAAAVREARDLNVEPDPFGGASHRPTRPSGLFPDSARMAAVGEEARERDLGRRGAAGSAGLSAFGRLRRLADRHRRFRRGPEPQQRQCVAEDG